MISISVDPRQLIGVCAGMEKQLPFATANALNRSAEETQFRLQQALHQRMSIKSAQSALFMERMIKIPRSERATKAQLSTRIVVEGPQSKKGGDRTGLITRHIEGGTHARPGTPFDSFFIPAHGSSRVMPRSLYPKNLRLMDRRGIVGTMHAKTHITSGGKLQIKGKQRTFVLMKDGRPLGVFQRQGKDEIDMLWFYTPRVTLQQRFDFYGIAERTFLARWPVNFEGMWNAAIATAK